VSATTHEELPLWGVRVVDLANERAEICGRVLADLGADVLRIEPPEGAPSRRWPPFHGSESIHFQTRNANKRVGTLDVESATGQEELLTLLGGADVWIETSAPGSRSGTSLDPEAVCARFPRLVVTSITNFGQTGPYRDYEATEDVIVAMSSLLCRSGVPELPPLLPPGSIGFDCAGVLGAMATMLALWQRARTGRGQWVDLSALEALAQSTDWGLVGVSGAAARGVPYREARVGSGSYGIYPCADGLVRLIILQTSEWLAVRRWLGDPEELRYLDLGDVAARSALLPPLLQKFFGDRTMLELTEDAQSRKIAVTPVLPPQGVLESPHFRQRQSIVEGDATAHGISPVVSGMFRFNGNRAGFRNGPRHVGPIKAADHEWAEAPLDLPDDEAPSSLSRPLDGLLVIDLGQGGVGVEITRQFAEFGADVIKLEARSRPDFMRLLAGTEISGPFASSSRSKRSFGVNVRTPEGLAIARQLIAMADVVVENSAHGAMAKMGLSWADIRAVNPRCVMLSSQLLGDGGDWETWKGYGPQTRAVGGMTYVWNYPDRPVPVGASYSFPDHYAGRTGAIGALAGLFARARSGRGVHVEAAQVDSILYLLSDAVTKQGLEPGSVKPQGNRRERGAPWGVYPCAGDDRWCVITCRDDTDWSNLRAAIGDPEWAQAGDLQSADGRQAAADRLDTHLSEWTAQRTDKEVMRQLQACRVPAGMMMYVADQMVDPHLVDRGFMRPVEQPGVGSVLFEGPAFKASGMLDVIIAAAPGLGDHTRDVARSLLKLEEEEIEELISAGVLDGARPDTTASPGS
jgi:crotonobetainyl-CoA:carnitine CoA-transferase CaiB-like acyl-CoA transferase